ncbi:uncharacterized protein LOC133303366 [Gastrolobium bilobum]|uniref:uncharacterized protein LOC133303366 n=1 Tax=Gastrolobium bilobum TaxID=150636 RepID=UPI002AB23AB7|nr:uncharacterized protein LOC133303366 [Gastrolobium bilobum]
MEINSYTAEKRANENETLLLLSSSDNFWWYVLFSSSLFYPSCATIFGGFSSIGVVISTLVFCSLYKIPLEFDKLPLKSFLASIVVVANAYLVALLLINGVLDYDEFEFDVFGLQIACNSFILRDFALLVMCLVMVEKLHIVFLVMCFAFSLKVEVIEMDKSWINMPRNSVEYLCGLDKFLDFAFEKRSINGAIKCPCPKCRFNKWETRDIVRDHLICKQFPKNYKVWIWHGETYETETSNNTQVVQEPLKNENPVFDMINDAFGVNVQHASEHTTSPESLGSTHTMPNEERRDVADLIKDGNQELYEGCQKYSKLSFLLRLYHIKCLCGITDKAMTLILELLRDAFEYAKIPNSFYEAKKVIYKLGLNYTKIDACPKNCMLYWGENESLETCEHCQTSRWKPKDKGKGDNPTICRKKRPAKVLRYFPLKPRLKRLFMCSKTAKSMRWHALANNPDGLLRHPRDAEAWKSFDQLHPEFASESRNVRLGLATDGFNPYGTMSNNYSVWPVILIPYNRPPWECMKQTSLILSMIIPGKRMPGNNIDVFLQPLIKELNELWSEGMETYDSSMNELFRMRAALIWTISDFPGLGSLSGWNIYTGYACPTCNFDTTPCRLKYSKKWCFMGHRRFLEKGHTFRLMKKHFDDTIEERDPPKLLSGFEILKQLNGVNITFGRNLDSNSKRKRDRVEDRSKQWRKKSIFFDLPYWKDNLLRHNLDVMHIEKNVCDNVLYTLIKDDKSKDHHEARKDLKHMGIKQDLWPLENGKFLPLLFTMTGEQRKIFLTTLKNTKMPDGYSSNISRCIDDKNSKISGLKSHDCHIILQHLLPIAIRNVLPDAVTTVLVELSAFFKELCFKRLNISDLDKLQHRIVLTLCHLEILLPPSFFTVMVHLTCHLVQEVKLGGPVYYRWMYPIERALGHFKSFVRNKAQPEGSISEAYLAEETLNLYSQYEEVESRMNRGRRVDDRPNSTETSQISSIYPQLGRSMGSSSTFTLTPLEKIQAHRYLLLNCPVVTPYVEALTKRRTRSRRPSAREIEKIVTKEFANWFPQRVMNPDFINSVPEEIKFLARGSMLQARRYTTYNINGFKFRTIAREASLKTQNSGVFLTSNTSCVASSADPNLSRADLPYYEKLMDIIELNYYGFFKVILFKCKWADTTRDRGIRKDAWEFTSVNFSQCIHTGEREEHDPYIEASQARLVYYVDDEVNQGWSVVVHMTPRDLYDMGEDIEDVICETEPYQEQDLSNIFPNEADTIALAREDVDGEFTHISHVENQLYGDEMSE